MQLIWIVWWKFVKLYPSIVHAVTWRFWVIASTSSIFRTNWIVIVHVNEFVLIILLNFFIYSGENCRSSKSSVFADRFSSFGCGQQFCTCQREFRTNIGLHQRRWKPEANTQLGSVDQSWCWPTLTKSIRRCFGIARNQEWGKILFSITLLNHHSHLPSF